MRARLKDVAARAGVSLKTVSNVVHGYPYVTDETRARVQAAIEELNYRPNLSARSLRKGRSGILALALPRLDEPYFAELASWVIKAAEERSCTVLVDQTEGLRERELLAIGGIRPHLIDGLILSPLALGRDDLAQRSDTTPLVLLGERVFAGPADHVAIDNVAAARLATGHLLGLGRRRVAAVGAQSGETGQTGRLRLQGYREALVAAGIEPDPALVAPVPAFRRTEGATAVAELLDRGARPDALFCFNDLLALGALRVLFERGLRVPDDVAVVGFDDIEEGRFSTPTLTTVAPDKPQIAREAVDALLARIGSRDAGPPREVRAEVTLQVRESTAGR